MRLECEWYEEVSHLELGEECCVGRAEEQAYNTASWTDS